MAVTQKHLGPDVQTKNIHFFPTYNTSGRLQTSVHVISEPAAECMMRWRWKHNKTLFG